MEEYLTAKQVAKYLQINLLLSINGQEPIRFRQLKLEESGVLKRILLIIFQKRNLRKGKNSCLRSFSIPKQRRIKDVSNSKT